MKAFFLNTYLCSTLLKIFQTNRRNTSSDIKISFFHKNQSFMKDVKRTLNFYITDILSEGCKEIFTENNIISCTNVFSNLHLAFQINKHVFIRKKKRKKRELAKYCPSIWVILF